MARRGGIAKQRDIAQRRCGCRGEIDEEMILDPSPGIAGTGMVATTLASWMPLSERSKIRQPLAMLPTVFAPGLIRKGEPDWLIRTG
ncbi:MAG: hypothetical protein U1E67_12920 [Hyphomicrobiales bacterium]